MFTINLNQLCFFSYHGVHEEEKILGNEFEVDAAVIFESDARVTSIDQTVNYVDIYNAIKKRMGIPTELLETLAQDLVDMIQQTDSRIRQVSVSIKKKHPPVTNITGSISVSYKKTFN